MNSIARSGIDHPIRFMPEAPGWHDRGYLPHYDNGAAIQSITYRLADALPHDVLAKLEEQTLDDEKHRSEIEH